MRKAAQPSPPVQPFAAASHLRWWLFALLAAALLLPVAGAVASDDADLVGEVILEHADDFDRGRAVEYKVLQTNRGRYVLTGPGADRARENTVVRVRGKRQGDTLHVATGGSVTTMSESVQATGAGEGGISDDDGHVIAASGTSTRVAVLLINFTDPPPPATPEPSLDPDASPTPTPAPTATPKPPSQPWTRNFVRGVYFNNARSVANYYDEVSNSKIAITGDVFGYYTLATSTNSCNYSQWGTAARQAASAAGVNLSQYDYVVHAWGRVSACWWGGLAQVNGKYNWINGSMTPYVTIHELGHNFGAHHAATMTCTQGGSRVTLSNNCTVSEYGDPFDVMGQNASGPKNQRHLQAWHRRQVGFLSGSDQLTVSKSGHYTVATAQVAGGVPRSVRVARGNTGDYFYLEFRQPYGRFDDFSSSHAVVNGVLIRLAPHNQRVPSKLLDMNPSTSSFSDAALAVGKTFTDSAHGISIKTMSISPSGAVVRIQVGPDTVPPTTPGNLKASINTDTSIRLTWTASTDDLEVTGYRISRDGVVIGNVNANTLAYTDTNLTQGVTYNYSVVAVDAANNQSTPATVSRQLPDTIPPTAPGDVTATQSGPRQVTLTWAPATDNGVVALYRIRRNGSLFDKTSTTTFVDNSVVDGFSYSYEVRAEDAAGNLGPRVTATPATISLPDVTPPTAPGSLSLAAASTGSTSLSWTAATDNVAVAGYRVMRNGTQVATLSASARTFSESSLPAGTYLYSVVAFDAAGNVGPPKADSVTVTATTALTVPTNLKAVARDGRSVDLSWSSSSGGTGAITYRVFRNGTGSAYRIADGVTGTSFTDRPSEGAHTYRVRARDAAGRLSDFSAPVTVTAVESTGGPPAVPQNLSATALDNRYVQLTWSASTGKGPITYRVFRNGTGKAYRIANNLTTTSFTDRPSAGTHTYRVRARDADGNLSSYSTSVTVSAVSSVSAPLSAPTGLSATALDKRYVQLNWNASSGGSGTITYRIFRNDTRIAKGVTATNFLDRAPSVGTHRYKIRAVDSAGNKSAFTVNVSIQAVRAVAASLTAPQNLAGQPLDKRYVRLTWDASLGGSGTVRYRVFRNDTRIAKGVTNTTYLDRAPSLGTFRYKVRAVDGAGNKSEFTPNIFVVAVRVAQ